MGHTWRLEDTVDTDLDCLDATALEQSLCPVPAPGHHIVTVLRVIPPQVRHQLRLHVELYLVSEHIGHHSPHHQDGQHQGGHRQVHHQQALHLLVAAVESKQTVEEAEDASNHLQHDALNKSGSNTLTQDDDSKVITLVCSCGHVRLVITRNHPII